MDKLASYSSDTESEQFDKSSPNRSKTEHDCNTPKDGGNLAAEWESFEKLISGSGEDCHEKDVVHVPSGVPAPTTEPGNIKQQYLSTTETRPDKCKQSETSVNISPDSSGACLKRKASLSSDSSESNSDSESADSSGGSSDSSEESSESDEPHSKKARSSSTSSEKHKSSSSDEESDEETSDEDGSNESDASSEEGYKQKSSGDEDTLTVTSKKEDHAKKASDDHVRKKDETSSSGSKWSLSKSRRSRSHDRHKSSRHDRKKRDRSRGRKHHRRHSRHRSHHSRSHDRHHSRSRTRAHRQKRSRSRERRKRSSRHHSRSRSRDRYVRSRRHSRDRHRRWRSPPNPKTIHRKPITYKEVLRQKLMEAQQQAAEGKLEFDPSGGQNLMSTNEKPSPLPLMSINPLMSLATGPPGGEKVTPQQALMQTMAAMHQKAQELTGVAVPKYYNPAAVNPLKFAEQVKKRKLLWSKKDSKADAEAAEAAHQAALDKAASTSDGQKSGSGSSSSQWKSTAFLEDKDGRMAAKFRKLMGIKDSESSGANDNDPATEETIKKQQELFNQLDREYQFARMTTHTHRGIGLGFTSQMYPDLK